MNMLVSVGIPVYSGGVLTRSALESVLSQEGVAQLEVVVIDDGSPEPQEPVLDDLLADPRVRFLRHTERRGAAATWNELIAASLGTFVKILPQDDVLLPGALAAQTRALRASDAVLVAGRSQILTRNGRAVGPPIGLNGLDGPKDRAALISAICRLGGNPIGAPGAHLMRSEAARMVDFRESDRYVLDLAHSVELLRLGDMIGILEPHVGFRISKGAWTWRLGDQQVTDFMRLVDGLRANLSPGSDVIYPRERVVRSARRRTLARRALYTILG
jgi:glycosyltransferase involved in cell wall biosynthesis